MPTLTHPIGAAGPILDLWVGVTEIREAALKAQGLDVPAPIRARALIDTGASAVLVDSTIIERLALTPTGTDFMHTPSTAGAPCAVSLYDIALHLVDNPTGHVVSSALQVVGHPLAQQHIGILLGRTFLASCVLNYDGPEARFRLDY